LTRKEDEEVFYLNKYLAEQLVTLPEIVVLEAVLALCFPETLPVQAQAVCLPGQQTRQALP
jgi:hypothetical protein